MPAIDAVVETAVPDLVSSHFLTRFVAAFGALSLLLTLAAMALVVPVGMRGILRRRRPTVTLAGGEGEPAVVEMDR